VRARLCATSYRELYNLGCRCKNGAVTLRGQVTTYFLKQVAQEIARGTPGVKTVANQIKVSQESGQTWPYLSATDRR
jgi:osmotically-inducible protein OsmY